MATVQPAWAVDANNGLVPTHYEIHGTTLTQVVNHSEDMAYPVVADPAVQADCGWITCTIRLDRAQTRNARDASWIIGSAATLCAFVGGIGAAVCGAAVAIPAVVLAVAAGRYYEDGDCLGIKIGFGPSRPSRVSRGSHNCR